MIKLTINPCSPRLRFVILHRPRGRLQDNKDTTDYNKFSHVALRKSEVRIRQSEIENTKNNRTIQKDKILSKNSEIEKSKKERPIRKNKRTARIPDGYSPSGEREDTGLHRNGIIAPTGCVTGA